MTKVKNVMDINATTYCNGEKKAIKVHGIWAYAQHPDGMSVWKYNEKSGMWELCSTEIFTNY